MPFRPTTMPLERGNPVPLRGPVLAATDLSEAADAPLRQGHAIASGIGAPFVVCHVLPEAFNVRVLFPQDAGIDTSFQTELEHRAREAVHKQLDATLGARGRSAPIEIETGTAHAGILTIAERIGAGVIVVGPGGTAHRVARATLTPVLVARPSPMGGSVLGATDFSDPSLPALKMAAEEAARRGVRFRAVHCLHFHDTVPVGGAGLPGTLVPWPVPSSLIDRLESASRERLAEAVAGIDRAAEVVVLLRPPASGIVETAATVATALVVVGTRGRTGLARLALGSVAERVLDRAPCSVLIVPLHAA